MAQCLGRHFELLKERFHSLKPGACDAQDSDPLGRFVFTPSARGGGPLPSLGGPVSRRGRVRVGAQRTTRHFPSRVPGSLKPEAWLFSFCGKGATPDFISGHQICSPRPRTARRLSETCLLFPFFFPLFLLLCFFRGPSPLAAKTPCALLRAAPPGRPEGPHCRPPVRAGPRARRRAQAPLAAATMPAAEPPPPEDSGTTPRPNF